MSDFSPIPDRSNFRAGYEACMARVGSLPCFHSSAHFSWLQFLGASQFLGSSVMLASRLCCTVRAERAVQREQILCIAQPKYKTRNRYSARLGGFFSLFDFLKSRVEDRLSCRGCHVLVGGGARNPWTPQKHVKKARKRHTARWPGCSNSGGAGRPLQLLASEQHRNTHLSEQAEAG